jgi:hypothetical protein
VYSFYSFTVDISVEWSRFKAAAAAINNTVQPQFVKELTLRHVKGLNDSMKEVAGFLTEVFNFSDDFINITGCPY